MEIDKLALFYIKDKQLLVARPKNKEFFYVPGGKREQGEPDKEALIREIKEELSVDIIPDTLKFVSQFKAQAGGRPEGTILKMTCYSGEFAGEIKPSAEIEEVAWFAYDNDLERATPMCKKILGWLKERDLIN